jgi:hypothetical protein
MLFSEPNLSLKTRQRTFETAADCPDSWRVVCVSHAALIQIVQTTSAKGLRRAHPTSRYERARHLFERNQPLDRSGLLQYFFKHDTVALVTTVENAREGATHWSKLYEVPVGIFTSGSFSIHARKSDLEWSKNILAGGPKNTG